MDCLKKTVKQEGFFGLYRGFVTGVIGTTHGAVQIAAYSWIIDKRCQSQGLPKDSFLVSFRENPRLVYFISESDGLCYRFFNFQGSCHNNHIPVSSSSY